MTLGKFPLDTNLTKWLSRCEGAFHKGKDKMTLYGSMYAIVEIKKKTRKRLSKGNMKEMEEETYGNGGRWSHHFMGENHPDKC